MSNSTETLARQRICSLLDEKSFMEIGSLVTARSTDFNLTQVDAPSDGVITGYGLIDGKLVYVYSQDASVLGGTIGEMHAKKIAAVYDMAMKMGAPVIGLLDCAGVRLQESVDALWGLGHIYTKQVEASGMVPQICAVFGTCGGGLTVVPALSDFTYLEAGSKVFVNSPDAIPGNTKAKCDTSKASYQSEHGGFVDGVGTAEEIFAQIRELVAVLPSNHLEGGCQSSCEDDLNRACEDIGAFQGDAALMLSQISDDNLFIETKKDHARDMTTGFLKLNGMTVGAVANCSCRFNQEGEKEETHEAAFTLRGLKKAAEFVRFCDAFEIPVLSLTNVEGFSAAMCSEKGLARAMADLVSAFASATVPKVNILTGNAYGSAYVMMNSKAVGADLVYAWDTSKIGMMDANLAAKIMYEGEAASVIEEKAKEYEALQSSVLSAAKRGYVDLIISPKDTRKYAVAAFEMLYTKRIEGIMKKHGSK